MKPDPDSPEHNDTNLGPSFVYDTPEEKEIERLMRQLSELHAKYSVRTKECNILVEENRRLIEERDAFKRGIGYLCQFIYEQNEAILRLQTTT